MLQEYKLSENEIKENSVEGSKIYWKGDAVALQRLFDRLGKFLIGRYNGVIDLLDTSGITEKVNGANIKSIRLNDDKIMEYSLDGKVFEATGSSGHIIIDEIGNTMPQRSRLHFNNAKVTDDGYLTIVSGVKGEQGSQGVEGPQGIQGIQGIQGLVGSGGPQGIQGIRGERGYIGERGEQGIQGIQGIQGERGNSGEGFVVFGMYTTLDELVAAHPTGQSGQSFAVGTAVENTVYVWDIDNIVWQDVGKLMGAQGPRGEQGPAGAIGPQGSQGIQGPRGEQGEQGIQGVQGEQGERGLTGAQGVQGVQGIKGDKGVQGEMGAAGIITSINGKSATTVTLSAGDITASEYLKAAAYSAVSISDSLNTAVGKLEKRTDLISVENGGTGVQTAKQATQLFGGISVYTHIKAGTVHALVGSGANIKFLASEDFSEGDTFTVNGDIIPAFTQDGEPLSDGFFKSENWVSAICDDAKLNFKSGGAALNIKVVGGTAAPVNPTENIIWVDTATAIPKNGFIFDNVCPTAADTGMVFIDTSAVAGVDISNKKTLSVLKHGQINLSLNAVLQYTGTAWETRYAKIFLNNQWVDISKWIYNSGTVMTAHTNSVSYTPGPVNETSRIRFVYQNQANNHYYYISVPVNLINNKLCCIKTVTLDNKPMPTYTKFAISTTPTYSGVVVSQNHTNATNTTLQTYTLDVLGLSGKYYLLYGIWGIGVPAATSGQTYTQYIHEIYLK